MNTRLFMLAAAAGAAVTVCVGEGCAAGAPPEKSTAPPPRFVTPVPRYPFIVTGDARRAVARVSFDARGKVTRAVLVRSTGSTELDNLIVAWVAGHWKCRGGGPATITRAVDEPRMGSRS